MQRPMLSRFAEVVALLVKAPRDCQDLSGVLDISEPQARTYLRALKDEGLIYVSDWRKPRRAGPPVPIYSWQPSVCQFGDVARPKPDGPLNEQGPCSQRTQPALQANQ